MGGRTGNDLAIVGGDPAHGTAQMGQVSARLVNVVADSRTNLDLRLHELGLNPFAKYLFAFRKQELRAWGQGTSLRIENHVLLFDTNGERGMKTHVSSYRYSASRASSASGCPQAPGNRPGAVQRHPGDVRAPLCE